MTRKTALALVADVVLVVVFCLIGRRSHHEAALAGIVRTAWPFLSGLLLGWFAVAVTRRDNLDGTTLWPVGVAAWLGTLIGGMVLRVISGQGTALSFIAVAATVLAVFLLGWRTAARLFANR